jgi:hemolysin activation/secretion protein
MMSDDFFCGIRRFNRRPPVFLLLLAFLPSLGLGSTARAQQAGRAAPIDPLQAEKRIQTLRSEEGAKKPPSVPQLAQPKVQASQVPLFRLQSISVRGAQAISPKTFAPIYRPYLGRRVSQRDLEIIADRISAVYRKAGYYLSRAIIPPQDVKRGHLTIRVIEGSIVQIRMVGDQTDRFGVRKVLEPILKERPSRLKTVERQLLLANVRPGVHIADTAIEEIGSSTGHFRLIVTVKTWGLFAAFGIDDLGTYAIGPLQSYATTSLNSLVFSGDSLAFSASTVPDSIHDFRYGRVSYDVPIRDNVYVGATALQSEAVPDDYRRLTNTRTFTRIYDIHGSVVALATRENWLTLGAGFGVVDSKQTENTGTDYSDRAPTITLNANYKSHDGFGGWNYVGLIWRQGLNSLGATQSNDPLISRYGAKPDFSVLAFSYSRLQTISNDWSIKAAVAGQFASGPLLTSEEFYLGGSAYGPGYYSGDNGYAGIAELRFTQSVKSDFVKAYQLYGFVDGGQTWYMHEDAESLVSAGGGLRLQLDHDVRAGLGVAVPVSYTSQTDEWRRARVLFSLSSAIKACPEWAVARCF